MKPAKLKKGGNIRIIAPASAPSLRSLTVGVSKLVNLGYRVSLGDNIRKTKQIGYLSASDQDRANELNEAFADDSVDAIFCARGGYGSLRILPLIDFDIIKDHPKIFVGYSDITALHLAIGKKTDLITFHGPMPGVDFEHALPNTLDEMFRILVGDSLDLTPQISRILGTVVDGETTGISAGTNFSLVTSLFGTEFQLIPNRRILFLEDVSTSILDIDRYMAELLLSKTLYQLKGMVFGDFVEIPHEDWPVPSLKEVIYNYVNKMKKPIVYGMPFGHGEDQMTIPLNAEIKISTEESSLVLLEDVVD